MKIFRLFIYGIIVLALYSCNDRPDPAITAEELRAHVNYLASEDLKGRLSGTEGDLLAASYIEDQFKKSHLIVPNDSLVSNFNITTGIELDSTTTFTVDEKLAELGSDFVPLSLSESAEVSGDMVFAGYGFKIDDESLFWDDFAPIDCAGKIVIILLGAPEPLADASSDPFEQAGSIRSKVLNARDKGAAGVILVSGSTYDASDKFAFESKRENSAGLPVLRAGRLFIDSLFQPLGKSIDELETELNSNNKPVSFSTTLHAQISVKLTVNQAETRNVLAYIPAKASKGNDEWIVIGAHFDHLGLGGSGSGSRVPDTIATHYGADDNASGVAGIIELAGWFEQRKDSLKRSVLFVAFTGEELGLLGSKQFVSSGWLKPEQIECMINLDMIGRPNTVQRLAIGGTGTAEEFQTILDGTDFKDFTVSRSPEGYGPSDHASFYQESRPVLYFSTGAHEDYHTPGDTPDKLNYDVMTSLTEIVGEIAWKLTQHQGDLHFQEAGPKTATSGRRNLKVTLGIMPDFAGTSNDGLRVDFVTPGKPADLGGMLKGDRIVGINGKPVTNIYDYMTRLQQLKTGQVISVDVVRESEKIVLIIQL